MREPAILPSMDGTTMSGSTAPALRYTQAAEVLATEIMKVLVAAATLSGAPMTRLNTGTLAHPAPRPRRPARNPTPSIKERPSGVFCTRQRTSSPVELSR